MPTLDPHQLIPPLSLPPSSSPSSSSSFSTMPTTIHKPVSTRRGSVSASDAYGKHAHINIDPNRSSSSILTIVRVPPPQAQASSSPGNVFQPSYTNITLQEPPSTHITRRHGHHHGHGRRSHDSGQERMSFAFSSFNRNPNAPSEATASDGRSSPTSSPRLRPSSPTQFHQHTRQHQQLKEKPRLTPDQLVDLARQSTDPSVPPPSIAAMTPSGRPQSPGARNQSPSRNSYDFSPSPSLSALNSAASAGTAPATFTPLPDDIYLPFIDRPAEVSTLVANPPSSKLLALLAQTFPKQPGASASSIPSSPIPPSTHTPSSSVSSTSTSPFPGNATQSHGVSLRDIPNNPLHWTFQHLTTFLTTAPRPLVPDFLFIILVRKCMMSHSELIWERLKGALGVPVELDVDVPDLEHYYLNWKPRDDGEESDGIVMSRGSRNRRSTTEPGASAEPAAGADNEAVDTEEIEEDGGRKAYGYWEDWDAVMDSPVWARRNSIGSIGGASLKSLGGGHPEDSPTINSISDSVSSLTGVSIEPLLLPTPAAAPESTPGGSTSMSNSIDGLQDIGEEEEEEEEEVSVNVDAPTDPPVEEEKTQEQIAAELAQERQLRELREMQNDPDLVYPSRIQGLQIKTTPVPQDPTGSPLLSAVSVNASPIAMAGGIPLPPVGPGHTNVYDAHQALNTSQASTGGLAHGRSASFSSLSLVKSSGFFAPEFTLPSGASVPGPPSSSSSHGVSGSYGGVQRSNSSGSLHNLRPSSSSGLSSGGGRGVSAYAYSAGGRPLSAGFTGLGGYAGMGMSSRRSSHGSVGSMSSLDLGNRAPGNPLFPSNFARLTGGPTLNAHGPTLHSPSPSASRFNMHHVKPRSRPPSRSSTYSYTSEPSHSTSTSTGTTTISASAAALPEPVSTTPRRAAGVINSGAGMALGILPGGVIVRRRE